MEKFQRFFFFRVFTANFRSLFKALKVTAPYIFGIKPEYREITEMYPDKISARMAEDLPTKSRGLLFNDIEKCSGCRYCSDVCPVSCISIKSQTGPDRNISWISMFDIDHSKCIFCGLCVENCPTGSLIHTGRYELSTTNLGDFILRFGKGEVTNEMRSNWISIQEKREAEVKASFEDEHAPIAAEFKRRRDKN